MCPSAGALSLVGGSDQGHGLIDRANFSPFEMRTDEGLTSPSAHNNRLSINRSTARSVK
jgi:hypothetical protein